MTDIIDVMIWEDIDKVQRHRIYKGIIEALEGHDWDTQIECLGLDPAFDEALYELHPDWR